MSTKFNKITSLRNKFLLTVILSLLLLTSYMGPISGDIELSAEVDGFNFPLESGSYWEYDWERMNHKEGVKTTGTFRITLEDPVIFTNVKGYTVNFTGDYFKEFFDYDIQYLAMYFGIFLASFDGENWYRIFDAQEGHAQVSFFWFYSNQNIQRSYSRYDLTDYPGFGDAQNVIGIHDEGTKGGCGNYGCEDWVDWNRYEFFKEEIGPYAYFERYKYTAADSSFFTDDTYAVGLSSYNVPETTTRETTSSSSSSSSTSTTTSTTEETTSTTSSQEQVTADGNEDANSRARADDEFDIEELNFFGWSVIPAMISLVVIVRYHKNRS